MAGPAFSAPRETFEQHIVALQPGMDVYLPEGEGPFPVLIQLHGCGGKKAFQTTWAQVARKAGWAAIVVDSFKHRNISQFEAYATVCTGLQLWGQQRAGDLYAAMEWARRQPWADRNRIVAAGWSHGGWTALDAMSLSPGEEAERTARLSGLPKEPLEGLVGAFLMYPYAGPGMIARTRGLRVDVAPLGIVGLSDVVVGGRSVGATLKRMTGAAIEVVEFEGATHAFDEGEARDLRVRFDPELTRRAQGMLVAYLARAISRAPVSASRHTPA